MGRLQFLGMSFTNFYTYSLRNVNHNSCYRLLNTRPDNVLQVKRYKHLCRLTKTTSLTSQLTKSTDLTHKPNIQTWNIWSTATSTSCPRYSRSAVEQARRLSTSSCHFNDNKDDDILKDDPYLKDLLKEIREEFSSHSEANQPVKSPEDSEVDEMNKLNENNDKIVNGNKVPVDVVSSESSDSDKSDSDSSSSSDGSSSDEDDDPTSGTVHSDKLSQQKQATPTEPDLDIGGFISLDPQDSFEEVEEFPDTFEPEKVPSFESPIDLKRGVTGVYDVEELVTLLKSDNAKDVCVIRMPDHLNLGDYIVVVTAWSYRHMKAITKIVVKIYKLKKNPSDNYPLVSGADHGEWVAFDLGNILLHVFKEEVRERYDLETLWAVGPKFDDKSEQVVNPYILENSDLDWLQEFYKEKAEEN